MASVKFDIPHDLGKAEARRRVEAGLPKLEKHIPGGGRVESRWTGADELKMDISAMGQTIAVVMVVGDTAITGAVAVPMMLSMMSGAISDFVKTSAEKMLTKG